MKIYQFEFNCDKETAIKEVLYCTEKPVLLFEQDVIYGRRIGSFVSLYRGISYQNSFRPVFKMHFKEIEPGKTVAKGVFKWHWFITLFSVAWLSVAVSAWLKMGNAPKLVMLVPLFFILFFVGLVSFCTYLERNNKKEIIEHIKMHQSIINNK